MSKISRVIVTSVAVLLTAVGLAACGSGGGSDPVIQAANRSISKAEFAGWLTAITGGDYFESRSGVVPSGLVSDPPNYPACIADIEKLMSANPKGSPKPSKAVLRSKCELLHNVFTKQTASYLLNGYRTDYLAAGLGVKATEAEVMQRFNATRDETFTTEAELHEYLSDRRWPLSVELYLVKQNLLEGGIRKKLKAGGASVEAALDKAAAKFNSETSCQPGYVVEYCKQYKSASAKALPAPYLLFEEIQ
jgi:hypothetical protein